MREEFQAILSVWIKGALLIILIVAVDIIIRKMGMSGSNMLLYFVWGLFMVAVFISTTLSPRHKLVTGMLLSNRKNSDISQK